MKRSIAEGPDELRARTTELWNTLSGGRTGSFFPPLAGAAVSLSYVRFGELFGQGVSISDDDVWALYSLPHEAVHLVQAITSTWFFEFNRDLTRMAMWAAHYQARGDALPPEMKTKFRALHATLTTRVDGFSAHEILETQAVIEGFWGAMANPNHSAIVYAARKRYPRDSPYLHILNLLVQSYGDVVAVDLAPRLCAIALQFDQPGGVMADLLSALSANKANIRKIQQMSFEDFLKSSRLDPQTISRSFRERGGVTSRDAADAWFPYVMSAYFDRYEQLDLHSRLNAMMHPGHVANYAPASRSGFLPMYALFDNGLPVDLQRSSRNTTDFARWVDIGLAITDGIRWLCED
jgi:hypothetical protein